MVCVLLHIFPSNPPLTAGTPYEFNLSLRITGVNFAESLGDWYFKRGKVPTQLMDSCHTVQCNPMCPSKPT